MTTEIQGSKSSATEIVLWFVITTLSGVLWPGIGILVAAIASLTGLRASAWWIKILAFICGAVGIAVNFAMLAGGEPVLRVGLRAFKKKSNRLAPLSARRYRQRQKPGALRSREFDLRYG
ncbi:hypothetical protein [Salininema proteolyticum]|uniref:Uncharacterized protein n=1 Tax=Salininema proteolyticum TaxID=1607685 RepID=A0ABV8TYJ2_9ACTN